MSKLLSNDKGCGGKPVEQTEKDEGSGDSPVSDT